MVQLRRAAPRHRNSVAVEVGFEPTDGLPHHTLSRRAPSATRRLHRRRAYLKLGPGPSAATGYRRRSKKSRSNAAHSSPSTPLTTSTGSPRRGSCRTSHTDPAAPALGS
jgi:hypothetical protein